MQKTYLIGIQCFQGQPIYCTTLVSQLFHSHPSLEVVYMFLLQKEWHSSIPWRILYYFDRRICSHSSIVWVIFWKVICLFPKISWFQLCVLSKVLDYFYKILAAIHSFNGTVHFSDIKIYNHTLLLTHFLSAYFRTVLNTVRNELKRPKTI